MYRRNKENCEKIYTVFILFHVRKVKQKTVDELIQIKFNCGYVEHVGQFD